MESLEKQLICPICLEMFTKPVVILPCQHNLCRKCANDVFQASNPYVTARSGTTTSGGRFRCPSCRHEVVLDRHGVYGLQRNLLVENIIDMYKQGSSSKAAPEVTEAPPTCSVHQEEKINIYCVSCSAPTCSMCKVFGAHKDCEVAPLHTVFTAQKAELTDCISMLVGNNERIQAIISHLEETGRAVTENGGRQKSKVCETFDHLFALLEEKKGELSQQISVEQDEKLQYLHGLRGRYTAHLDGAAALLQSAITSLEQAEMAVFLQESRSLMHRMMEGTDMSRLETLQHGYENMDHFKATFTEQRRALATIEFNTADEDVDYDDVMEEEAEPRTRSGGGAESQPHAAPAAAAANQLPPLSPAQLSAPPPQRPSDASITSQSRSPASSSSPFPSPAGPPPQVQSDQSESEDQPRHVFSFSWLNQK